jgi:hypothetical protein
VAGLKNATLFKYKGRNEWIEERATPSRISKAKRLTFWNVLEQIHSFAPMHQITRLPLNEP